MPTLLITGANRGIGLEFVRQYVADGWSVIAAVRAPDEAEELRAVGGEVRVEALDVTDFGAVERFAAGLKEDGIDLLIANAGVWQPERMDGAADAERWVDTFRVNAIAPVLLARGVYAKVKSARGKLVAITSQMGSIADNGSGGYIAYRSSKAALNAAWKSLAIEAAGDGMTAAVMHPGWVQTRMGGASAPLTPEESVAGLRRTIAALGPDGNGGFFNYDGTTLPW